MDATKTAAQAIQEVVATMMDRVLQRVLLDDPFIKEAHHAFQSCSSLGKSTFSA